MTADKTLIAPADRADETADLRARVLMKDGHWLVVRYLCVAEILARAALHAPH